MRPSNQQSHIPNHQRFTNQTSQFLNGSVSRSPEPTSGDSLDFRDFVPPDPRGGEDDALRQAVAAADLDVGVRKVQDLDHHFVRRPRVVGIDDADAVGDLKTTLEWGAASGENRQAMSGWNLDNESSADEHDATCRHDHVVRGGQVESSRFVGAVGR